MKALIHNNLVVQVAKDAFEVHSSLIWMDAPEGCEYGWELVEGVLQAPPKPTAEELSYKVRTERDALLAQTDWWASSDLTITDAQKVYRQALRDVPKQEGFPDSITWPTKPS